jgi:hypothetical protein
MIPVVAGGDGGHAPFASESAHRAYHSVHPVNDADEEGVTTYSSSGIVPPRNMSQFSGYYDPTSGQKLAWNQLNNWTGYVTDAMGTAIFRPVWSPASRKNGQLVRGSWTFERQPDAVRNNLFESLYGPNGGSGSTGRDAAAQAADQAQADYLRQKAQLEREDMARQERQARLSALMDNLQFLNQIQPDLARFGGALNSVPVQGITPTIGYGNAIQQNINTLQGQLASPPPAGTPIPTTPTPSLAGTGAAMGMTANPMQLGTTKRGVLVGDREINGDEELLTMDPSTGQVEVIPIVGRAAEGATFNFADYGMNNAQWDTTALYGALSPLYQPFGITSAGAVPTKANATPTSLGYIQPRSTTDFSPTQPSAYGPLSQTYFEKNTGMLLPNPSTILRELRVLKAQNPVAYATALSFYANATTQDGKPSGLPPEAIDTMIENAAIQGRSGNFSIGLR